MLRMSCTARLRLWQWQTIIGNFNIDACDLFVLHFSQFKQSTFSHFFLKTDRTNSRKFACAPAISYSSFSKAKNAGRTRLLPAPSRQGNTSNTWTKCFCEEIDPSKNSANLSSIAWVIFFSTLHVNRYIYFIEVSSEISSTLTFRRITSFSKKENGWRPTMTTPIHEEIWTVLFDWKEGWFVVVIQTVLETCFLCFLSICNNRSEYPDGGSCFRIILQSQIYVSVVLGIVVKNRSARSLSAPDTTSAVGKIKVWKGSQWITCEAN